MHSHDSTLCHHASPRPSIACTCIHCGKDFYAFASRCDKYNVQYCGYACRQAHLAPNRLTEVTCKDCGKTWQKRTDSLVGWLGRCRSCANSVNKKGQPGHQWNEEQRARQSATAREQVFRQGGIPNARIFPKGHKPANFIDGTSNNHSRKIRTSVEYDEWRRSVYKRDNFTCQECGKRGGRLNAHHIKSILLFPELTFAVENGTTLCVTCHEQTTTYRKQRKYQERFLSYNSVSGDTITN
jgi:uncharacterized protein YlzI (FlbEa/FlbD family)